MALVSAAVDLRSRLGPARDQGARPTCLAFAISDGHAMTRGPWSPLSCEFLFYHAQRRAGRPPTEGALVPAIREALLNDGQPAESGWPYLVADPQPTSWSPPATVGVVYRCASVSAAGIMGPIVGIITAGHPVIVVIQLSAAFYAPTADGVVDHLAGDPPDPTRVHAVLVVGHGTVDRQPAILVRNSWGPAWGTGGYAWLTRAFLGPRLLGSIKLP